MNEYEDIFKAGIKAGEGRITGALSAARSTSPSAARMTMAECLQFIRAYNDAIKKSRPNQRVEEN